MNRRILASIAVLVAWWGIAGNVAHAQTWRLGTYGQNRQTNLFQPGYSQNLGFPNMQPGMLPNGTFAPVVTQQTVNPAQPTVLQTGHPVTYFNTQQYFPLNYGTSSGSNIAITGITGIGGNQGLGQDPTGGQQSIYFNQGTQGVGTVQRGRLGIVR